MRLSLLRINRVASRLHYRSLANFEPESNWQCPVCDSSMLQRNSKRHASRCCPDTQDSWSQFKQTLFQFIASMQLSPERDILVTRFGYPAGEPRSLLDTAGSLKLSAGKVRSVVFAELGKVRFQGDQEALEVLLQDEHMIVVNKPPRLKVPLVNRHAGGSLLSRVVGYLSSREDASQVQPAHRLDNDTSGVMVFAKNTEIRTKFLDQFTSQQIHKQYLAICKGSFDNTRTSSGSNGPLVVGARFTVDVPIGVRDDLEFYFHERVATASGKPAITDFEVLDVRSTREKKNGKEEEEEEQVALVRAFPRTGRTHQIRVHLAHVGLPILFDKIYGLSTFGEHTPEVRRGFQRALPHEQRQRLHAEALQFLHPTSAQPIEVKAPLPEDFLQTLAQEQLTIPK